MLSKKVVKRRRPDTGSINARENHDGACNQNALCRTVDDSKVQSMGMVGLPGREEHRKARAESCKDTGRRGTQTHRGGLEQAGKGAVERVDSMVEEFAESARSSRSPGLLSVQVVEGLVHEQSECEAKVQPRWPLFRKYQSALHVLLPCKVLKTRKPTGPTRSGMKISKSTTLPKMKKNPMRVTMFGASHNGRSSTAAFHCRFKGSASALCRRRSSDVESRKTRGRGKVVHRGLGCISRRAKGRRSNICRF